MIRWLSILYVIKLLEKYITLTATPNSVDVTKVPILEDFLTTECREILDILLEMVVLPSSKYFDTENTAHVGNHIYLQFQPLTLLTSYIYYIFGSKFSILS